MKTNNDNLEIENYILDELEYNDELGGIVWKIIKNSRKKGILGSVCKNGYIRLKVLNKWIYVHRIVWFLCKGNWPKDQIDHINRIRSDNRICNLQEVSNQQNTILAGTRTNNTSGYQGVSWMKQNNKWISQIRVNGKLIYLGIYKDAETASKVYEEARLKFFQPILNQ